MMRALAATLVLLLAAPAPAVPVRQVSHSGYGAYEASLTAVGRHLVASWYDTRDGHPEIYFRLMDERGAPLGDEHRLTNGADFAYEPDVAALGADVAVAWYEQNAATSRYHAELAVVTADGRVVWRHRLSATGRDGKNPVVRAVKGDLFCAWLESEPGRDPEVRAQWFDHTGRELTPARRVAAAGKTTWNLNAAADDDGRMWVVFDATVETRADELFAARVSRTSSDVSRITADDGVASKYPDIAVSHGRAAVTWFDEKDGNQEVYLAVAPSARLIDGVEAPARRITNTPGASIGAYLAWNGDVGGLAWCDNSVGQHEIYFVRFGRDGATMGAAARLTDNRTESLIPAIRAWRDGFALLWNEYQPGEAVEPAGHASDGRSEVWFAFVRKSP